MTESNPYPTTRPPCEPARRFVSGIPINEPLASSTDAADLDGATRLDPKRFRARAAPPAELLCRALGRKGLKVFDQAAGTENQPF